MEYVTSCLIADLSDEIIHWQAGDNSTDLCLLKRYSMTQVPG